MRMQTDVLTASSRAAGPRIEKLDRLQVQDWPAWLAPVRKAAFERFSDLGFPTIRHEDWRFTNVSALAKLPLKPVLEYSRDGVSNEQLERFHFSRIEGPRLVFINGHYSPELSAPLTQKDGTRALSLRAELRAESPVLMRHLTGELKPQNAFGDLNTALFQDGAFIYVAVGKTLDKPVHLIFISTSDQPGATASPRNVIVAEKGSKAVVFESYVALSNAAYFTNAVTTVVAADDSQIEHLKFQDEGPHAYHIAGLQLQLSRQANVISHSIALGAKLSRNNIYTHLGGEGIECVLNGLYLTKDEQLADHWMLVEHAKPYCNSHEYFNGIVDDRSKGVFHGRIFVQPEAQKTDAKQTNKNLLLSESATVDTKPQLEIYADDVKCTHGATIGQLNEEAIFYLRSRGIGPETARRILIHAFAGEIIERVRHEAVREELDQIIWERLESNPHIVGQR
jgi:Fe-S cluster assembly protein SufD